MQKSVKYKMVLILWIAAISIVPADSLIEKILPTVDHKSSEYATVQLMESRNTQGRAKRDTGGCFSDVLKFRLTVGQKEHTLELEENTHIDLNKDVYTYKDGEIVKLSLPQLTETKCFHDTSKHAAIGITAHSLTSGGCEYILEGTFLTDSGGFVIHPFYGEQKDEQLRHIIRKVDFSAIDGVHSDFTKYGVSQQDRLEEHSQLDDKPSSRFKRAATVYNIELFTATDILVYEFWYNRTMIDDPVQRHTATLDSIRQYYAFILNGIDLRYRNIIDADVAFRVKYAGIFITTDIANSPVTADRYSVNPADPHRDLVAADGALLDFAVWRTSFSTPTSDFSILFTRGDIVRFGSTDTFGVVASSVCLQGVALTEDKFDFITVLFAAHVLGLGLGATIDDSTACGAADRYIMSNTPGPSSEDNLRNHWLFSNCSVDAFKAFTTTPTASCLLNDASEANQTEFESLLGVMAGQFYSIDEQCIGSLGNGSYLCRGSFNGTYDGVCAEAPCAVPGSTLHCTDIVPARGTPCGNQKWCIDGYCVFNPNATVVSDTCPFGDQPGELLQGLSCEDVKNLTHLCYSEFLHLRCCETCAFTGNPDCAYGDRVSYCQSLTRKDCYTNEFACCGFCLPLKQPNNTECEYGDRIDTCFVMDCPTYNSTTFNMDCCETCAAFSTTTTTVSETTTSMTPAETTTTTPAATTTTTATTTPAETTTTTPAETTTTTTPAETTTTTTPAETTTTTTPAETTTTTTPAETTTTTTPAETTTTTTPTETTTTTTPAETTTTTTPAETTTITTPAETTTTTTPAETTTITTPAETTTIKTPAETTTTTTPTETTTTTTPAETTTPVETTTTTPIATTTTTTPAETTTTTTQSETTTTTTPVETTISTTQPPETTTICPTALNRSIEVPVDCVQNGSVPWIIRIADNGYCDRSSSDCLEPVIQVTLRSPVYNTTELTCRFTQITVDEIGPLVTGPTTEVQGNYINCSSVVCPLPNASIPTLEGRALAGWLISVSNDGTEFRTQGIYLPYDSRCVNCDTTCPDTPVCTWAEDTCFIDGMCYNHGYANSCRICDVCTDFTEWSVEDGYCFVNDTCFADGDTNPFEPCDTCNSTLNATGFTTTTEPSCVIAGQCYADGATNPSNACERCNMYASSTTWSVGGPLLRLDGSPITCSQLCANGAPNLADYISLVCLLGASLPMDAYDDMCFLQDYNGLSPSMCPGYEEDMTKWIAMCLHGNPGAAAADSNVCP